MNKILFLVYLISIQASANWIDFRPHQHQLVQKAVSGASAVVSTLWALRSKPISGLSDEIPTLMGYLSQRKLVEDPRELLIRERVKNFDWVKYERLEKAFDSGAYLSSKELREFFWLQNEYQRLEGTFGFEAPSQLTKSSKSMTVPGMRMAGCGASSQKKNDVVEEKKSPKQTELDTWDSNFKCDEHIKAALEGALGNGGHLDLSDLEISTKQLEEFVISLPTSIAQKILSIDLAGCGISGTLPSLEKLTVLQSLNLNRNRLKEISQLPASLEEIHADSNQLEILPDFLNLTKLRAVDVRFNQLREFPLGLYQLLHAHACNGLQSQLNVEGNLITEAPPVVFSTVVLSLDNHPNILHELSGSVTESVSLSVNFPDAILEKLYLGSHRHLVPETLKMLGITQVVNCANDREVKKATQELRSQGFQITELYLDDSETQTLDFQNLTQKLDQALRTGTVLVNCAQGISRSATLVIAYLMLYQNMTLIQAVDHVKARRQCIQPNAGFLRQLIQLAVSRGEKEMELLDYFQKLNWTMKLPENNFSKPVEQAFGTMLEDEPRDSDSEESQP